MFIHLENGLDIIVEDVIAILDYELFANSVIMEAYEEIAREENRLIDCEEDVKSALITADKVYFSSLSVATLRKKSSIGAILGHLEDYSDDLINE